MYLTGGILGSIVRRFWIGLTQLQSMEDNVCISLLVLAHAGPGAKMLPIQ